MFDFIYNFELFIFDLDGCIIDSEYIHYKSYKSALEFFNININFEYNDYVKLLHSCDSTFKNIITTFIEYDKFYSYKENTFKNLINEIKFIDGAVELIDFLLQNNKKICIVTNSSLNRVQLLKSQLPFLNKIEHWITKNDAFKPKPSSECYLKAIKLFDISFNKIIIFEDSYKGFKAVEYLPIHKVLIQKQDYYYYNLINCINKYDNFSQINIIKSSYKSCNTIQEKIEKYQSEINYFMNSMEYIICMITPLIIQCSGSIYLCGIGKSRLVCNKCVSTWQSLGIHANSLITQDLFHGDFGIFKENDIIIYISNSGNTDELLNVSKYIKKNFNIFQISITNNENNLLKQYTNLDFLLGDKKIIEADNIDMAPTVSSILYMTLLDLIGVNVAEYKCFTKEDFKKYHPGGNLGKK